MYLRLRKLSSLLAAAVLITGCGSEDNQPPALEILSPKAGAVITEPTEVLVDAHDRGGLDRVIITVDGEEIARLAEPPWKALWNPLEWADGRDHQVRARAFDDQNNTELASVVVRVARLIPELENVRLAWEVPEPNAPVFSLLFTLAPEAKVDSVVVAQYQGAEEVRRDVEALGGNLWQEIRVPGGAARYPRVGNWYELRVYGRTRYFVDEAFVLTTRESFPG